MAPNTLSYRSLLIAILRVFIKQVRNISKSQLIEFPLWQSPFSRCSSQTLQDGGKGNVPNLISEALIRRTFTSQGRGEGGCGLEFEKSCSWWSLPLFKKRESEELLISWEGMLGGTDGIGQTILCFCRVVDNGLESVNECFHWGRMLGNDACGRRIKVGPDMVSLVKERSFLIEGRIHFF